MPAGEVLKLANLVFVIISIVLHHVFVLLWLHVESFVLLAKFGVLFCLGAS